MCWKNKTKHFALSYLVAPGFTPSMSQLSLLLRIRRIVSACSLVKPILTSGFGLFPPFSHISVMELKKAWASTTTHTLLETSSQFTLQHVQCFFLFNSGTNNPCVYSSNTDSMYKKSIMLYFLLMLLKHTIWPYVCRQLCFVNIAFSPALLL